jgi:hypothetical protein
LWVFRVETLLCKNEIDAVIAFRIARTHHCEWEINFHVEWMASSKH